MIKEKSSFCFGEGSPIKQIRQALGLTQEQFAVGIGVGYATVGSWERGANEPSFNMAQMKRFLELVEPLGLTWKNLPNRLGFDPPPKPPEA